MLHFLLGTRNMPTINENDRPIILERLERGETQTALAQEYGVTQATISLLRRKHALNGNNIKQPKVIISLREFINKAWQAREDALSVMGKIPNGKSELQEIAIDAADGAATAWKKAAAEISKRSGQ